MGFSVIRSADPQQATAGIVAPFAGASSLNYAAMTRFGGGQQAFDLVSEWRHTFDSRCHCRLVGPDSVLDADERVRFDEPRQVLA